MTDDPAVRPGEGTSENMRPEAQHHKEQRRQSHWWLFEEDEGPPDWYRDVWMGNTPSPADRGGPLSAPPVPDDDEFEWSDYVAYQCGHCRDDCINRRDSEAAENRECWSCVKVPTLEP